MSQNEKIVLVTGAGRGIGKAILIKLAKSGMIVVGADYNEDAANNIGQCLNELGCEGMGIFMDVSNTQSVNEAVKKINEKYGKISILVNNAGITKDNLLMRMSPDEWNQVVATNLTSVFNVSQACIRDMIKAHWGRIINIASVVGYAGNYGQTNYAATKAGVIGFSKSLALEVASRNITVNCVAPGFIETDMTKKLNNEHREKLISIIPMKRIGSSEEVAHTVEFLVSDDASYITGTTIHINGGMYMI